MKINSERSDFQRACEIHPSLQFGEQLYFPSGVFDGTSIAKRLLKSFSCFPLTDENQHSVIWKSVFKIFLPQISDNISN